MLIENVELITDKSTEQWIHETLDKIQENGKVTVSRSSDRALYDVLTQESARNNMSVELYVNYVTPYKCTVNAL